MDIEPPKAIFRRVAVRVEHQREGHGRVMLMLAEEFAGKCGRVCARSDVAPDADASIRAAAFGGPHPRGSRFRVNGEGAVNDALPY